MSESTFQVVQTLAWFVKLLAVVLLVLHLGWSLWLVVLFVAVIQVEVS
jgi:fatty acid desaturase